MSGSFGPTLAGFQSFITDVMGINPLNLPTDSPVITYAFNVGLGIVNPALWAAGIPNSNPPTTIYALAVYNLAADNLVNFAQDQPQRTYFRDLRADLHITRDHGGYVEEYKAKYARIRDNHERVIIDGICNSACTLVFGIVPMNKICVTPRASVGFHLAYYDKAFTFGIKVTSTEGTSDLMSYYPDTVKDWIRRNGGLTTEMKKIKNGGELWKIVDPCPDEW